MKSLLVEFLIVAFLVLCFFSALYMNSLKRAEKTQETNFSTEVLPKMGQ